MNTKNSKCEVIEKSRSEVFDFLQWADFKSMGLRYEASAQITLNYLLWQERKILELNNEIKKVKDALSAYIEADNIIQNSKGEE